MSYSKETLQKKFSNYKAIFLPWANTSNIPVEVLDFWFNYNDCCIIAGTKQQFSSRGFHVMNNSGYRIPCKSLENLQLTDEELEVDGQTYLRVWRMSPWSTGLEQNDYEKLVRYLNKAFDDASKKMAGTLRELLSDPMCCGTEMKFPSIWNSTNDSTHFLFRAFKHALQKQVCLNWGACKFEAKAQYPRDSLVEYMVKLHGLSKQRNACIITCNLCRQLRPGQIPLCECEDTQSKLVIPMQTLHVRIEAETTFNFKVSIQVKDKMNPLETFIVLDD